MSLSQSLDLHLDTSTVPGIVDSNRKKAGKKTKRSVWRARGLIAHWDDVSGAATAVARLISATNSTVRVADKPASNVFLEETQNLAADQGIDAALDHTFRTLDAWFRAGEFKRCDEVLRAVDVGAFHEDVLVGFLTITLAAKKHLPSRPALIERCLAALNQRIGEHEARRALVGLD